MSFLTRIINNFGFKKVDEDESECYDCKDGRVVGSSRGWYDNFVGPNGVLTSVMRDAAYKIAPVGSSIDLIANNMQMVEPVFWDDKIRNHVEYIEDENLRQLRRLFEQPNSTDTRKTLITKAVKSYCLQGVVYFAFYMNKKKIVSLKTIDPALVIPLVDMTNNRIGSFTINNAGVFSGEYRFAGTYYINTENSNIILAPYVNGLPGEIYYPSAPIEGAGIETLLYWYGCSHNKSMLQNGARPSIVFFIKSSLAPKLKEELREEIYSRFSGARNAGRAMIIDGAAEKDMKLLSQSNKDMEFNTTLQEAKEAIYTRLGTNWLLGLNQRTEGAELQKALETFYDMTVCPLFQAFYNHIFNVYKYFNKGYEDYRISYLEYDIPALRPRFLQMMKEMPNLGIFLIKERRAMYGYPPLGDERDNELSAPAVTVKQTNGDGKIIEEDLTSG